MDIGYSTSDFVYINLDNSMRHSVWTSTSSLVKHLLHNSVYVSLRLSVWNSISRSMNMARRWI
jgi:hypothetical protein